MLQNSQKPLFMFPGQGSQYSGMGKDWFNEFQAARLVFEEASDFSGLDLKKLCFEGSDSDLKATEITQPAILTTTVALWRSLVENYEAFSIAAKNAVYAGHSLGEYSALVCSGFYALGPVAKVVKSRGAFMQQAVPPGLGTMAALMFKPKTLDTSQKVREICDLAVKRDSSQWVEPANYNSHEQIVISGTTVGVKNAIEIAAQPDYSLKRGIELAVSAPFHCRLMQPAAEKLKPQIDSLQVIEGAQKPLLFVPNVTAKPMDLTKDNDTQIKTHLVSQITGAVRWVETVQAAREIGCLSAVEIGPGSVLSGLVKRIDSEIVIQNVDRLSTFQEAIRAQTI